MTNEKADAIIRGMGKIDFRTIPKSQRLALYEEFFQILHILKRHKDRKVFLIDVLTESELVMLGRRILIARHLLAGKPFYRVKRDLGVGLDTIRSVHHWLEGKFEDYRSVIPPLYKQRRKGKLSPLQLEKALKRAYSPNYLLLKLLFGYHVAERHLERQYTVSR